MTAVTDAARPPLMGCEGTGRRDETPPIWADNAVNSNNGGCRGLWKRDGEPNSGCGAGRMADTSPPWGYPNTAAEDCNSQDCNSQDQRMAAGYILNRARESKMEIPGYTCHEAAWTPPKHDRQFSAHQETRSTADIDYTAGNVAGSSSRWPNSGSKCPIRLNRFGVVHGAA